MANHNHDSDESNFEITSKRRKGFPSETQVKRGVRVVHGNKELSEKLGRNDLCPCGSGHRFQKLLPTLRALRRQPEEPLFSASKIFCGPKKHGLSLLTTIPRSPTCP